MPAIEEFPDVAETSAVHEFPAIEEFPDADAAAAGGAESVSPPSSAFDSSRLGADQAALLNLQDTLRGYNPAALNPMPEPAGGALVEATETPLDKVWRLVRQSKALRPVFGDPGSSGDDFQQRGIPATLASIPARPFVGAGKGAQAVVGDVAELEQGNPTLENLSAASRGEALPVLDKIASAALEEHERGEFGVPSLLAHISLGMADLAPKLLAMQGGPAMAGSVFGTGPDNSFDVSAGAMGAVLPGISEGTRAVVADAVDAGVKRGATWLAQPAVEKTLQVAANQAAMDGVMALQQSPELLELAESDPREFKRRVAELVGSNLAFAVPEIMRKTPTQEVFEGEPQNPTGIEPQRRRDAEMTKFLNAPLPETRNVRFKAEENISSPKTLVDADKDQVGYLGIQEFPAESSPAEAVQSSDPGLVQTPGAVAATPAAPESSLVPESGTLQAIAEQKPVTAQRVARVEASKPYTVEQALKDLPSVVQELKAALEANRLKPPEVSSQLPVVSSQPIQPARGDARPTTAIKSAERSLEYTLLDAVKDNGGLGGPDLETAMREMAAGKTAAQVTARYGAEYDALADVLETIFEARRGKKNNNVANQLAKAYEQAGFGGNRKGVDQALLGMTEAHQQGMGVAGGLPADHGDLIGRAWEMAHTRAKGGRELPQSAEGKAELFWQTATDPKNKVGLKKIDISELKVGDTFRLKGKGLSHEPLEVRFVDPQTGEVQVKDGPTFGTQDLPPGTEIYVQGLERGGAEASFAAGESSQRRAKPGGEVGENGEWYEGGKFIANTDSPKGHKKSFRPTGRREIEPGKWEMQPSQDHIAIYPSLAGTERFNRETGKFEFNENLGSYYAEPEAVKNRKDRIDAYNRGERWRLAPNRQNVTSQGAPQFAAGGEFSFDAPESVADQKARQAAEKRKADEAKAKEQILQRAGQKLTGKDLDTTAEMFGGETRVDKAGQGSLFKAGESSRTLTSAATGLDVGAGKRMAEYLRKSFQNTLPVEVVATVADLPASVQQRAQALGVTGVKGVVTAGKVYLVARNLADVREAGRIWLHEQAGHFATDKVLGPKLQSFAAGVEKSFRNTELMADIRRRYPGADAVTLGREYMAKLAENPEADPGAWRKIVARVRDWLRSLGFKLDVSENDVREVLRRAMNSLKATEEHGRTRRESGADAAAGKPVWRSNIEDALESWQNKGTPEQLRAHLAKTRGAMDQAEWIGLDDFLKDKPNVTRDQVRDFVRANRVDVQEVVKGTGENAAKEYAEHERAVAKYDDTMLEVRDELIHRYQTRRLMDGDVARYNATRGIKIGVKQPLDLAEELKGLGMDALEAASLSKQLYVDYNGMQAAKKALELKQDAISPNKPKYESYQLPGGENYREILLTLPATVDTTTLPAGFRLDDSYLNGRKRYAVMGPQLGEAFGGRYGHGDTPEQAIASFYRNHPPKEQFKSNHFDEPNILAHVRFNERTDADGKRVLFIEEVQSDWHQKGRRHGYEDAAEKQRIIEKLDRDEELTESEEAKRLQYLKLEGVPNAPFKQTWPMLAMKRMIRYASENGFDRIAWTTGEQQAARYDLSKQVDTIYWQPNEKILTVHKTQGGGWQQIASGISESELAGYIGKEAAEKIVKPEYRDAAASSDQEVHSLTGDNLKVGGKGMRKFYDEMLPADVNKFVKKWGGRVGKTDIKDGTYKTQAEVEDAGGDINAPLPGNTTQVHSLDITPAMRAAAMEGMPMFAAGEHADKIAELRRPVQELEDKVRAANRLAVHPEERRAAGLSVQQARNQRDVATAEFRRAQDALRENPAYIEAVMRRQNELMRGMKTESDPQRKADMEGEFETLQAELEAAPKKMVAAVHARHFMTGEEKTPREERAGAEHPGDERSELGVVESGAEIAAETPAARRKKIIKELPERTREVFQSAAKTKDKLTNLWTARENRDSITASFDAAENGGNLFGKQAANEVLHALNRSFGATGERVTSRNPVREQALTFVIESGLNEGELNGFEEQIRGSAFAGTRAGKDALAAIRFAQTHWERLKPVAELYSKITDAQVEHENLAGVETLHRKGGYVLHMNDLAASQPILDIGANSGFGPASPFLKVRQYATYADAVANGIKPKSINAVDLLQKRLATGQKLINHGAFVDGLRRITFKLNDGETELPVVTELQTHVRQDGKEYEAAPPGYTMMEYAGQKFAVLQGGFDKLLKSLITPGTLRDSLIGNLAMEAAGTIKHGMLVFDSYHLGRLMFWNSMVRGMGLPGNPAAYKRGLTLLDQTMPEIKRMVEAGEIPAKLGADLIESKRQLNLLVSKGLNVGGAADNIATHFVQHLPIAGRFNRFLFQEFQRGATAEASLIELRRQQKMFPNVPEEVLARRVAADLNTRFGNLQNQSWIKNKNVADGLRMLFLAPQWNESLIRSEIGAVKELGQAIPDSVRNRQLAIGLLGRSVFTAALGTFLANQVINYITRGKPTWDNEEESEVAKISAWIPDVVGNGPGYFLNPLTLPAEMSELLMKKTERSGDMTKALKEALAGRLGPLGRIPYTLAAREDSLGAKLKTGGEVMGQMVSNLVPAPISGGTIVRAGKQLVTGQPEEKYPGQFQRQAAQTFGIKLDSAPTADQRIGSLAKEFNRKKGITPGAEYFHGDYYELDNALRIGNERDAKAALEELLQKKTPKDIRKHYETWARARFTGKTDREAEFKRTLNPEQLQTYEKARQRREEIRQRVNGLLR